MHVIKVVDLVPEISKHFHLYFYDFSMICYAILKFAILKTKAEFMFYNRVLEKNSINTFRSLTGFPWRGRYCPAEIRRSPSPAGRGKKERGMGELRATCLCLRIGLGMAGVGGTAGAGTPARWSSPPAMVRRGW